MCVVKVNRVESNSLGLSSKEPSHNLDQNSVPSHASSINNYLKAETVAQDDSQHLSASGIVTRTPEGQWPDTSQVDQTNNDFKSLVPETQDLPASQDCSFRIPHLEVNNPSSPSCARNPSAETSLSLCSTYPEAQTSCSPCTDTSSPTPNTGSTDAVSEKYKNTTAKTETMDTVTEPKHISSASTIEALYDPKTKPVEGNSCTSCCAFAPSAHCCSLDNTCTCNTFPPLLQSSAVDMPQLTPEPTNKIGICSLPPVLTQEMPSLTPADDRLADASKSTLCSDQVAPVLQREIPTGCPLSHGAKQELRETHLMMSNESLSVEHVNEWHLDSPYSCGRAAVSDLERHTADLPDNALNRITSSGVPEMLIMPDIASENDFMQVENLVSGHSDITPGHLVHSSVPQTAQRPNLTEVTNKHNSKDLSQRDCTFTLSNAGSLITGNSNHSPPQVRTQSGSLAALQLHSHTTYSASHCASQSSYMEAKPFSSSIWKNLNSQSPAVLIQSLHTELPSDMTHDPLPYTMWTEPQCKEVTNLEDTEQALESENQEEGGPLTWAQLEPTSLVSVGTVEPYGDYEVHRGGVDGVEAPTLCRELGRQRESGGLPSHTAVSPLRMGGGEQDMLSDMEEGTSDEEEEQQSSAKGDSSSDSSDEENETSNNECDESGLEPGEVCAVSVLYEPPFTTFITKP